MAIIDWYSHCVLPWRIDTVDKSLGGRFRRLSNGSEGLKIFKSDQAETAVHFEYVHRTVSKEGIAVSMVRRDR